ncbi:MAG: TRAP transporter small permease subunit [Kofleriaceae bacterium]
MTERSDGPDGADEPDLPPTRKHAMLPPARLVVDGKVVEGDADPQPELEAGIVESLSYPDDGTVSAIARKIDGWLGKAEQVVLVALLAAVVLTAAGHALLDRLVHVRLEFKDEVIRGGTFAIAILGGAFATHQIKNLRMDLVSRRISPTARLFVRVGLGLFALVVLALVIRAAMPTIEVASTEPSPHKWFTPYRVAWLIPIGAALVCVHTLFQIIIDIDYLVRGKTPPERMLAGH